MAYILTENYEPNEPYSRFDGPTTIAHKLAEETKRLTREAVRRYRSKSAPEAIQGDLPGTQPDRMPRLTEVENVAGRPVLASRLPITPFKPDVSANPRERAVDSTLMDEIRQARSLLVDEVQR